MKPTREDREENEISEGGTSEKSVGKDFKHIVRIADVDINGDKRLVYALTEIKGIGFRVSQSIVRKLGMDPNKKIGSLSEEEFETIRKAIEEDISRILPAWMVNHRKDLDTGKDLHFVSTDLEMRIKDDINFLKKIRCYRGIRHEKGLPVRGQRTRSNGRKGLALGVQRKKK